MEDYGRFCGQRQQNLHTQSQKRQLPCKDGKSHLQQTHCYHHLSSLAD